MMKNVSDRMQDKFLKQKTKRPKGKPLKNFDYKSAAVGGVKYKKEKGAEQKILDMIITGMKDEEKKYSDIILYLKQQGKKINEEDAKFYELLANNIHNNVKINLNDLINSKNFLFTLNIFDTTYPLHMNVFSNDKLVWLSIVYEHCKTKFKDYLTFLLLDNMEISIRTLIAEVERDYLKGFYIDFSNMFSFIGCNLLTSSEQESFIGATTPENIYNVIKNNTYCKDAKIGQKNCFRDEFKLNGTDYIYNYVENGICFVCQKDKTNDAKIAIKNVKHIEGKTENDEKLKVKSTAKNKPFCYISQKIKLVNFSPSVIEVSNYFDTSFAITSEIELNKFEDEMYKQFISKSEFKIADMINIKTFVFLDNFEAIMQFLIIEYNIRLKDYKFESAEKNKLFQEFLKQCKELFEFYTENKTYFKALKSTCNSLIRFYLRFYDSFTNKINIDTSKSLSKICDKLDAELTDIKMNNTIREVIQKLSATFSGSTTSTYRYFLNSINLESHVSILSKIKITLNDIVRGNYTNLIRDLMDAGKAAYGVTLGSIAGDTMTREMRSPSSFMGNLYGGDMRTFAFASDKLVKNDEKKEAAASDYSKIIALSYDDKDAFKRGIALLSESIDGDNYDFSKRRYSNNYDRYWLLKGKDIKGMFKDNETILNKIKIYGTTCLYLEKKENPAYYGLDEIVANLRKLYLNYEETKKIRKKEGKGRKEEEIIKTSISPILTYEILDSGKGISDSMSIGEAIKKDEELLKKEGKTLDEFLMAHGFDKETTDDFINNGLLNTFAKYGITIAGLINYLNDATVDKLLSKDKTFFNDNAMIEMIKLSNSTNEIIIKTDESIPIVKSGYGPTGEDKKEIEDEA